MRRAFWILATKQSKAKQATVFSAGKRIFLSFRYTQMQLNKHCWKQKKNTQTQNVTLQTCALGIYFSLLSLSLSLSLSTIPQVVFFLSFFLSSPVFSQVFESIAMRVKLLVVIRSLPISPFAVLWVFWVWIPEEAVGGDGGVEPCTFSSDTKGLAAACRSRGRKRREQASRVKKFNCGSKKSQIWPGLWMDGCREEGKDGWMKGERKEGREKWMDGWMGYKVLQQIETRVYINAKFNKY